MQSAIPEVAERFEVETELGTGAMGQVVLAHDAKRGHRVALKTLVPSASRADDLFALKREFREVAAIHHDNLVALYDLFVLEEHACFTMEYVPGLRPRAWLDQDPPAGDSRLAIFLHQTRSALAALHRAGVVHADVKPANLLIHHERVVLLDFGLARPLHALGPRDPFSASGSLVYQAPEAFYEDPIPASDWYSLGVVLAELLLRATPSQADPDFHLRVSGERALPDGLEMHPNQVLGRLAGELLHPDPRKRAGAGEIDRALEQLGVLSTSLPVEVAPSAPVEVVGREAPLRQLHEALTRARETSAPVTAVLCGEAGTGKTTLLHEFARRHRLRLLIGRCYRGQRVPYSAIDDLVDHLCSLLQDDDELDLPAEVGALVRCFPVLKRVPRLAASAAADPTEVAPHRLRALASRQLLGLLGRLAQQGPTVLWFEDLHWGDVDSAEWIGALLRHPDVPALVVLSTRPPQPDDRSAATVLLEARGPDWVSLALGGLETEEALRLVERALGTNAGEERAQRLVAQSQGNPLLLLQLSEFAAAHPDDGTLDLDQLVQRRLQALPEQVRQAVELTCLLDRPVPQGVLLSCQRELTTQPSESTPDRPIRRATAAFLLRATGDEERDYVTAYHDVVREAVRRDLRPQRRVDLALTLAPTLDAHGGDPAQVCALYETAQRPDRLIEVALRTAQDARHHLAFARERHFLQLALAHGQDPDLQRTIRPRLAEALAATGAPAEGAAHLLEVAELDLGRGVAHRARAAELLFGSGNLERGMNALAAALHHIGDRPVQPGWRSVWALVVEGLRAGLGRSPELRDPQYARARLEVSWAASASLALYDSIRCAVYQTRHRRLARALDDPLEQQRACALQAMFAGLRGHREAEVQALEEEIARLQGPRTRSPALEGFLLATRGYREQLRGAFVQAVATYDEAERVFVQGGRESWERNFSRVQRANCFVFHGAMHRATDAYQAAYDAAASQQDLESLATLDLGTGFALDLARGDPAAARARIDAAVTPWRELPLTLDYIATLARVQVALAEGDPDRALALTRAGWRRTRPVRLFQNARVIFPWYFGVATLARPRLSWLDRRRVRWAQRAIARERVLWGDGLACALAAGLAARADPPRAPALAGQAAATFTRAGMLAHAAQAEHLRAQVEGDTPGRAAAAEQLQALGIDDVTGWLRLGP